MPTLSCSMWDLLIVSCPGIEPKAPALGAWSLSHWTTREVPPPGLLISHLCFISFPAFAPVPKSACLFFKSSHWPPALDYSLCYNKGLYFTDIQKVLIKCWLYKGRKLVMVTKGEREGGYTLVVWD